MFKQIKPAVLFSILLGMLGCNDMGNEPEPTLSVVTDKSTYAVEEYIAITISNSGDLVAHLPSCCASPAYHVDRYENGRWQLFISSGIPCPPGIACPSRDLMVTATENQHGATFFSERGTFRVRVPYGSSNENMIEEAISNTFVVQ
jgi:hypothetical protein